MTEVDEDNVVFALGSGGAVIGFEIREVAVMLEK